MSSATVSGPRCPSCGVTVGRPHLTVESVTRIAASLRTVGGVYDFIAAAVEVTPVCEVTT